MTPAAYAHLLRAARRHTRGAQDAEDLLQTVLLAAVQAGRDDLTCSQNRRWLMGALRKRRAFEARSAMRRRAREALDAPENPTASPIPDDFLSALPHALRRTATLALGGHTRCEIRHLLRISDAALRQRLTQIRRRWILSDGGDITGLPALSGPLPFGLIRRSLHPAVKHPNAHLGSHDPDGHLFVLGLAHKTAPRGN